MTRRRSIAAILVTLAAVEVLIVALLILPALSDDPPATIQAIAEPTEVRNPTDTPIPRSERLAPYPPAPSIPPNIPACVAGDLTVTTFNAGGGIGLGSVGVLLGNDSAHSCVIRGAFGISGVSLSDDVSEFRTETMCHTEPCEHGRFAVLPPLSGSADLSRLSLQIVWAGFNGRPCEESPGELAAFRLSWSSSVIDVPVQIQPCTATAPVYWRGMSDYEPPQPYYTTVH